MVRWEVRLILSFKPQEHGLSEFPPYRSPLDEIDKWDKARQSFFLVQIRKHPFFLICEVVL